MTTNMTHKETPKPNRKHNKSASTQESDKDIYPKEFGGRKQGLEPTRYGDWEKNGRCIDF